MDSFIDPRVIVMRRLLIVLCSVLLLVPGARADDDEVDAGFRRQMAPAVLGPKLGATPPRKEFNFGRSVGRAWLAAGGELQMDSWVQHRGLRCATYETGIRFGTGENGCADVDWLAPIHWLTSHLQCNSALMNHVGSDTDVDMVAVFDQVTCAQRLTRCTGVCLK
jgi:hypothetical protein